MSEGAVLADDSTGNALLDLVLVGLAEGVEPAPGRAALLELVQVERELIVHEAEMPIEHVYFPRTAVFGLMVVSDGAPPSRPWRRSRRPTAAA